MLKTAGVLLVSDLFLRGEKENKPVNSLLNELNVLDYEVEKFSAVPENEKIIIHELDLLLKQCDIVICVGELKNDVVFKALANATFQEFKTISNLQLNSAKEFNNYNLPIATKLITGNDLTYPIIQIQRIFVLKEDYLDKLFNVLRKYLKQYRLKPIYSKVIFIQMNGNTILILDNIRNSDINIHYQENNTLLAVTLESTCFDIIVECEKVLRRELQRHFIESSIKTNTFDAIYADPERRIQEALENIEKCLSRYGPENVFISFNGGKDCTVLLHLICAALKLKHPNYKSPIFCMYVRSENAFPEQDKFITQCQIYFNLEVMTVQLGIKEALNEVLLRKPNLKACFMGTRRTDPFSSNLNIFQMTDPDWPQVMRVSPILDWHYSDIWDYLLYYKVPYCKLYDMGFTSLGNALNTIRNPNLIYHDVYLDQEVYLPAYKMLNENKERSGRNIKNM